MIVVSLLSIFLVTFLCILCLVCQFKYEKKTHLKWHQTQQKIRRKSLSTYSNSSCCQNTSDKGYMPVNNNEDTDTIISVMEDAPLVEYKERKLIKVSRRRLIEILNRRFRKASKILQTQRNKKDDRCRLTRTNSIPLPCETFKQVNYFPQDYGGEYAKNEPDEVKQTHVPLITADQVKKALASKSKRYKKGTHYTTLLSSMPPPPPPSSSPIIPSVYVQEKKQKRYSRSFSDLLSIIELTENKTEKLLIRRGSSNDSNTCNNNNNVDSSNKTDFTTTTTTASIETIVQKEKGKNINGSGKTCTFLSGCK